MTELTDAECDAFRALPLDFNGMVRAIYAAGAARSADTSALQADARRIDWLDAEARRPGGILLHAESETGRSGLGLGPRCGNRHLRKAISQAMGGEPPPAAPGGPAGARRPDDQERDDA